MNFIKVAKIIVQEYNADIFIVSLILVIFLKLWIPALLHFMRLSALI